MLKNKLTASPVQNYYKNAVADVTNAAAMINNANAKLKNAQKILEKQSQLLIKYDIDDLYKNLENDIDSIKDLVEQLDAYLITLDICEMSLDEQQDKYLEYMK